MRLEKRDPDFTLNGYFNKCFTWRFFCIIRNGLSPGCNSFSETPLSKTTSTKLNCSGFAF